MAMLNHQRVSSKRMWKVILQLKCIYCDLSLWFQVHSPVSAKGTRSLPPISSWFHRFTVSPSDNHIIRYVSMACFPLVSGSLMSHSPRAGWRCFERQMCPQFHGCSLSAASLGLGWSPKFAQSYPCPSSIDGWKIYEMEVSVGKHLGNCSLVSTPSTKVSTGRLRGGNINRFWRIMLEYPLQTSLKIE